MIQTILVGVFVFSVLVFVHELGHFLAAKAFRVRVEKFSIGFGKRLFGKRVGETDYMVSLFPLGGYVKMAGDEPEEVKEGPKPGDFLGKPWWQKAIIAFMGPGMNLIFAFLLGIAICLIGIREADFPNEVGRVDPGSVAESLGVRPGDVIRTVNGKEVETWNDFQTALLGRRDERLDEKTPDQVVLARESTVAQFTVPPERRAQFYGSISPTNPAVIGEVAIGLPAYQAGLEENDRILEIDGEPVTDWKTLADLIHERPGKPIRLVVQRGDRNLEFHVTPIGQEVDGKTEGFIGIAWKEHGSYIVRYPLQEAVVLGFWGTVGAVRATVSGMLSLFKNPGTIRQSISGPIAIIQLSGQNAQRGIDRLLSLMAMISVALMVFNLLPVPVLDGGLIAFSIVEGIQRRPVGRTTQMIFQRVGLALLGSLILFVLLNDSLKWLERSRALSRERGVPVEEPVGSTPGGRPDAGNP